MKKFDSKNSRITVTIGQKHLFLGRCTLDSTEVKTSIRKEVRIDSTCKARFEGNYLLQVTDDKNPKVITVLPICKTDIFRKFNILSFISSHKLEYNVRLYRLFAAISRGDLKVDSITSEQAEDVYQEMITLLTPSKENTDIRLKDFDEVTFFNPAFMDTVNEIRNKLIFSALDEDEDTIASIANILNTPNIDKQLPFEIIFYPGFCKKDKLIAGETIKWLTVRYQNLEISTQQALLIFGKYRNMVCNYHLERTAVVGKKIILEVAMDYIAPNRLKLSYPTLQKQQSLKEDVETSSDSAEDVETSLNSTEDTAEIQDLDYEDKKLDA